MALLHVLLFIALFAAMLNSTACAGTTLQQWDVFELKLNGPAVGNPDADVALSARFTSGDQSIETRGFYDGESVYRIRFMPPIPGTWRYETSSNQPALNHQSGEFVCEKATGDNHGPVHVRNTFHFAYADGAPFKPIGTTSYGWACQLDAMEDQTVDTLAHSPFNKIRMAVLPIPYSASKDPLEFFPFQRSADGKPDFDRFDPKFFQHLEKRIAQLRDLNIQADLILFNPYNKSLGFADMTREQDDRYVRYVVARISAYRNVWWSLANEYDLIRTRQVDDWTRIGKLVQNDDPYDHLRSIHFSHTMYDPSQSWVTHLSVQNGDAVADFGRSGLYRDVCAKPVVYDEVCYEGNVDKRWGQLSGEEMTMRFWLGTIGGTYVGHGEVGKDFEGKSWTARGGQLKGQAPARIAFLEKILEDAPPEGIEPIDRFFESNVAGKVGEYYLIYFGKEQPKDWTFELYKDGLADGMKFEADVLDTWNMTITPAGRTFTLKHDSSYTFGDKDNAKIDLPGNPYMALRVRRVP